MDPLAAVPSAAVPSTVVPSTAVPLAALPSAALPLTAIPLAAVPSAVVPSTLVEPPLAVQTGTERGMAAAVGTLTGAVKKLRGCWAVPGRRQALLPAFEPMADEQRSELYRCT